MCVYFCVCVCILYVASKTLFYTCEEDTKTHPEIAFYEPENAVIITELYFFLESHGVLLLFTFSGFWAPNTNHFSLLLLQCIN